MRTECTFTDVIIAPWSLDQQKIIPGNPLGSLGNTQPKAAEHPRPHVVYA